MDEHRNAHLCPSCEARGISVPSRTGDTLILDADQGALAPRNHLCLLADAG